MASKKAEQRLQRRLEKQAKAKTDSFSNQPILQQSNDDDDYIVFSLKNLVSDYNLKAVKCTEYVRSQLLLKLQVMCEHTWNTIFTKEKRSGGVEIIDRKAFKVALPAYITQDIDHLYVIRFNGQNSRLVGFRSGNAFQAVFVDVDLSTYNHD